MLRQEVLEICFSKIVFKGLVNINLNQ